MNVNTHAPLSLISSPIASFSVSFQSDNLQASFDNLLDLVVHNEDKSTTGSTENVGECSLEEGTHSFVLGDLTPAVKGTVVELLLLSGLHHKSSSDSVEWVGDDTTGNRHGLSHGPLGEDASVLFLLTEDGSLSCVVQSEVGTSVDNNTLNRNSESLVQGQRTSLPSRLGQTVNESSELSGTSGTDISGQTGSGKIKRVDDGQGGGTSETTTRQVGHEEWHELGLWVVLWEKGLDGVLESKVESLGWEVSHDIGQVTSPEGGDTLLGSDTGEAVHDTSVSWNLSGDNQWVGILSLNKKLDSLDWSNKRLGDSTGNTTSSKISEKLESIELLSVGNNRLLRGSDESGWLNLLVGLQKALQSTRCVE